MVNGSLLRTCLYTLVNGLSDTETLSFSSFRPFSQREVVQTSTPECFLVSFPPVGRVAAKSSQIPDPTIREGKCARWQLTYLSAYWEPVIRSSEDKFVESINIDACC